MTGRMAGVVILALLGAGGLAAAPPALEDDLPGLKKPSVRIVVDMDRPPPAAGTLGWGMCVYRTECFTNVSLAAVDRRLKQALAEAFAGKGYAVVTNGAPDFTISYALAAGAAIGEEELNRLYGDLLKAPAAEAGGAAGEFFTRGALIVDITERKTRRLAWRGAILADIDLAWSEERKAERCRAAAEALLRYFPFPPEWNRP